MEVPVPTPPTAATSHVVVVPYPSRGHINPMMNMCKLLVSKNTDILVTFVVTEQWLASTASEPKPHNIRLASLPNLGPSADTFNDVVEAVMTQMEAPFDRLLDRLHLPPTFIICDAFLFWTVAIANRRNIPVAAFWTTAASELWVQYFHIFQRKHHCPQELPDHIPSISWIRGADIPLLDGNNRQILHWAMKCLEWLPKAQYLLLPSIYELELEAIDALKARFSTPIYTIGPNIPYFSLADTSCDTNGYFDWLDRQPTCSVLYISHGSYLSISRAQTEEIAAALRDSNVRFLWVARGESTRLKEICGPMGLVVEWCEQLRVLSHGAVGGYWTHCGWNSVIEGVFAGVPFLTFPLVMDQPLISRLIVDYWKVGWRVKKGDQLDSFVTRDHILLLLTNFLHFDTHLRTRAKELQRLARLAVADNGSSQTNINAFLNDILRTSQS